MPLYEYVCRDCQREQELLIRGEEVPTCQMCGSLHLSKLLSAPVAHSAGANGPTPQMPPGGGCGAGCACHGG